MSGKLINRKSLHSLLFLVIAASQFSFNDAKNLNPATVDVESFSEYHFHTYFDVNDPVQVAQAIQLRNEIIANCVQKKVIAVPLHYHYDPENPVLERKFGQTRFWNFIEQVKIIHNIANDVIYNQN